MSGGSHRGAFHRFRSTTDAPNVRESLQPIVADDSVVAHSPVLEAGWWCQGLRFGRADAILPRARVRVTGERTPARHLRGWRGSGADSSKKQWLIWSPSHDTHRSAHRSEQWPGEMKTGDYLYTEIATKPWENS